MLSEGFYLWRKGEGRKRNKEKSATAESRTRNRAGPAGGVLGVVTGVPRRKSRTGSVRGGRLFEKKDV